MNQAGQWQPKWGSEHDAIVAKYREAFMNGTLKGFVIVPRE